MDAKESVRKRRQLIDEEKFLHSHNLQDMIDHEKRKIVINSDNGKVWGQQSQKFYYAPNTDVINKCDESGLN